MGCIHSSEQRHRRTSDMGVITTDLQRTSSTGVITTWWGSSLQGRRHLRHRYYLQHHQEDIGIIFSYIKMSRKCFLNAKMFVLNAKTWLSCSIVLALLWITCQGTSVSSEACAPQSKFHTFYKAFYIVFYSDSDGIFRDQGRITCLSCASGKCQEIWGRVDMKSPDQDCWLRSEA